ncbi:hypothetical protein BCR42DRAFT_439971 [Absidia repens]|uniref:Uncharacterized protein n=1 Tax=Absidia repens TaxID=90262 RepID=A0A1X2IAS6_9FUNG|nr:hypothetical protein BCR42DRAFT_439971 [Absidia repens]
MNYNPIPCQFCDQFYDRMAQGNMDVYCADRSCYCPYGCGRIYNKAYLSQLRNFFPRRRESSTRDAVKTYNGHRHSIPPPLRGGTPLPPHLGRNSKHGSSFSESWRISKSFPHKESKGNCHQLNNHPATQPYFGIQTQKRDEFVRPMSLYFSDSAKFKLNMKEYSFDHIPVGATNDIHLTRDTDNISSPGYRLHPNRTTINQNNTFRPSSNYYDPSLETANDIVNTSTPSSSAAVVNDDIPPQSRMIKNGPSVSLSDYASEANLLLQEMRSMRQTLESESATLMRMSKYHKKKLIELDKCTKRYVNNVEYIQQLKYDMEKVKQDMKDRTIEVNKKKKDESRDWKNWCKRAFSLAH